MMRSGPSDAVPSDLKPMRSPPSDGGAALSRGLIGESFLQSRLIVSRSRLGRRQFFRRELVRGTGRA